MSSRTFVKTRNERSFKKRGECWWVERKTHKNIKRKLDTHAAFTYGTLLKRCGIKTSTRSRAPTDGTRHCMLSIFEVIFYVFFFYLSSLSFRVLAFVQFYYLLSFRIRCRVYFVFNFLLLLLLFRWNFSSFYFGL